MARKDFFDRRHDRYLESREDHFERQETLRIQLEVATEYHRDRLKMIFYVAVTAGTIFGAMVAIYLSQKGNLDEYHFVKTKKIIALMGICVTFIAAGMQWLSIRAYNFFGKNYIIPVAKELGIMPVLSDKQTSERLRIEQLTSFVLYMIYVLYVIVWIMILHLDLGAFN